MNDNLEIILKNLKELNNLSETTIFIFNNLIKGIEKLELYEKIEKCLFDPDLYLIYKHTDPQGKIYIGITQNHPQTRWNEGGGYEKNRKFYKSIQKYGWVNIKHEILDAGLSKEKAIELENEYILKYQSYDERYGYNVKFKKEENITTSSKIDQSFFKNRDNIMASNKINIDIFDVAEEICSKYNIITIDNRMFYLNDEFYLEEKQNPFIQRVLLEEYKIPTSKHAEIIKQIKILTLKVKNQLNEKELSLLNSADNSVLNWFNNEIKCEEELMLISTDVLYKKYNNWCSYNKVNVLGKKSFFDFLKLFFDFDSNVKQKSDGKRYFVKNKTRKSKLIQASK